MQLKVFKPFLDIFLKPRLRGPQHSIFSWSGKYTPQYTWLAQEFPKVNRTETPWLMVLMHSPWYNSYDYHYMEGETMRVMYEPWFVKYKVDVVFAGHVHGYERSVRQQQIFSSSCLF